MNRTLLYFSMACATVSLVGCGAEQKQTDLTDDLTALLSERKSLQDQLAAIDEKITSLDTTTASGGLIVSAQPVQIKDFTHKIEVQGTVETDRDPLISSEASGVIRKVHVKEGMRVARGQALVTVDAVVQRSQVQELETQLELARFMFDKQAALKEKEVGTEIEYEQAKSQVKSLESSIETMKSQIDKTVVRAPFSGVVEEVMASLGELAAPGVPLMRIVNNSNVTITASISENLLTKVKVGTETEVRIPSMNDTVIRANVTGKGNFIDPVNRTFRIRMAIRRNKLLIANQLAKVKVPDFSRKKALVVDAAAVLQDPQNNSYVYTLEERDGTSYGVEKVAVRVVKQYRGEACIEPLEQGKLTGEDRVVVKGAKGITPSDEVVIQ